MTGTVSGVLKKLDKSGEIDVRTFYEEASKFYKECSLHHTCYDFVAMGGPERQARRALDCVNKRSNAVLTCLLLVRAICIVLAILRAPPFSLFSFRPVATGELPPIVFLLSQILLYPEKFVLNIIQHNSPVMTSAETTPFRRSRQNSHVLRAFDFGYLVTSLIVTFFVGPQNILFVYNDSCKFSLQFEVCVSWAIWSHQTYLL